MALSWPYKDKDEVLDYYIDWSPRLVDGDVISSSTWEVPAGITQDSSSFSATAATIWLSGGTDDETYELTNRVTTVGGRTMDQSVKIKVKEK